MSPSGVVLSSCGLMKERRSTSSGIWFKAVQEPENKRSSSENSSRKRHVPWGLWSCRTLGWGELRGGGSLCLCQLPSVGKLQLRKAAPKPASGLLVRGSRVCSPREHPEHIKDENQEKDTHLPGRGRLRGYVWLGFASAGTAVQNYGNCSLLGKGWKQR